jgi:replication fork protection complex subunit Tof1/Swi1
MNRCREACNCESYFLMIILQKFADEEITKNLLAYLGRFRDFESPEQMKRVVGLIHRQAIKAKAEGLFFKV